MSEKWIRCQLAKGMFSDEVVIVLKSHDGEVISVFVPRDKVRGELEQLGEVRVVSFDDNSGTWAVLPNDQQTVVSVDASELVEA